MKVILAPVVSDTLLEIWTWTIGRFGLDQAERYDEFLRRSLFGLAETCETGRVIDGHKGLRCQTFKRRSSGHGRIAVYETDPSAGIVHVVRLLHTKMDVSTRLDGDEPPVPSPRS